MGIDIASVKLLLCAKNAGVDFSNTLQIGRQGMHTDVGSLGQALAVSRISADAAIIAQNKYSEPFFSALGATCISSLDVSDYEGATIIHDLNQPIPIELSQRFSLVHDGGTLQHVFNFPQALKNCMEMVRVGGHFTQVSNANNFMGFAFWQISPELIYRAFAPQNGFNIVAVLLHEVAPNGGWYLVSDPAEQQKPWWELRVRTLQQSTYLHTDHRQAHFCGEYFCSCSGAIRLRPPPEGRSAAGAALSAVCSSSSTCPFNHQNVDTKSSGRSEEVLTIRPPLLPPPERG